MKLKHLILLSIICCSQSVFGQKANQQPKTSGNPVFPGWYADPEGVVFGDEYTGFILRIRRLMTNRLSWMPSRLKTW